MVIDDSKTLGGNIVLSGFKDVHPAELVVVKKIVGSYARKFSDHVPGYNSLNLNLKEVHKNDIHEKYELHAKLIHEGKSTVSEAFDENLFVALDKLMKKLESQVF